jgi:hypothetical protein
MYVLVGEPHCGVTTTDLVTVFPSMRVTVGDASPDTTAYPFTRTVAWLCSTVGFIVTDATLFGTSSVYINISELKAGLSTPTLGTRLLSLASWLHGLITFNL